MIDDFLVGIAYGRDIGWQDQAACGGTDIEAFFPEKGSSSRDVALHERFGVWGGRSERERRRLTAKARQVPA